MNNDTEIREQIPTQALEELKVKAGDEALLSLYKSKSQDMVYYQCAEGMSYYAEKEMRRLCSTALREIRQEIESRGLEVPCGDYML
jgi:hypothetical protein